MKNLTLILAAFLMLMVSCKETKKTETTEEAKPLSLTEQMAKIQEKEKEMPVEETDALMRKANPGKGGKTTKITSGFVNIGLSPIVGEASVSHGDMYDTLRLKVTNWGTARTGQPAIWNHYAITHIDEFAPFPGRFVISKDNGVNTLFPNPVPSEWMEFWPHNGIAVSYFFGVSSDGGWNVAGKTIPNQ